MRRIKPLPNQPAMWHGLNDTPGQQDLFDCDLVTANDSPAWAKDIDEALTGDQIPADALDEAHAYSCFL